MNTVTDEMVGAFLDAWSGDDTALDGPTLEARVRAGLEAVLPLVHHAALARNAVDPRRLFDRLTDGHSGAWDGSEDEIVVR